MEVPIRQIVLNSYLNKSLLDLENHYNGIINNINRALDVVTIWSEVNCSLGRSTHIHYQLNKDAQINRSKLNAILDNLDIFSGKFVKLCLEDLSYIEDENVRKSLYHDSIRRVLAYTNNLKTDLMDNIKSLTQSVVNQDNNVLTSYQLEFIEESATLSGIDSLHKLSIAIKILFNIKSFKILSPDVLLLIYSYSAN